MNAKDFTILARWAGESLPPALLEGLIATLRAHYTKFNRNRFAKNAHAARMLAHMGGKDGNP